MDLQLTGKTALITGGSKGIGLAVAEGFAAEGVNLILCARDPEILKSESMRIADEYGVEVENYAIDLSSAAEIEKFGAWLQTNYKQIDIFISNAGQGSEEKIETAPDSRWAYYLDLHLMASVRLSRILIPLMNEGGSMIFNSSICARQPLGYEPIYNTTKAALSMFSKCLANELISQNIRVNTMNPGLIITPDWRKTATSLGEKEGITADEYLDRLAKQLTPIGRFGTPAELARFFVFLASPMASYSVGSTYYVDGGWLNVVD